jgi:hypothetical protein
VVAGDGAATVYVFNGASTDNGTSFVAKARTQQINPFPGRLARLGWVEVIGDAADMKTASLRFYKDANDTSYYSQVVSLDRENASDTKVRRRIRVNQAAQFHQVELEVSNLSGWGLDALVMWFQPDGEVKEF